MKIGLKNSHLLFAFFSLAPFLFAQEESLPVVEPPVGLNISGSTKTEYWFWLGKDSLTRKTEHFETNTSLIINYENFNLMGNLFLYEPSRPKNPLRLLGGSFAYRTPSIELTLGDFYSLFGRGLCLRSYYDENFRYDKRLFGFLAWGEFKGQEIRILSARPQNIIFRENTYSLENDTTDLLRGVEFSSSLIPYLELSGRYVRLNKEKDLTPQAFTEIFGPGLLLNYKSLEFYYEYAHKLQTREIVGGRKKGKGHYLTLSFSSALFGILLEYEDYDSIDLGGTGFRYNDPPTPIKKGISINRGTDERGFGINLHSSLSSLRLEGNYAWFYTHKKDKGIREILGKAEVDFFNQFTPVFTFEHLKTTGIEEGSVFRQEWKPGVEVSFNLGEKNFKLEGNVNFVREGNTSYQERQYSLSSDVLPILSLSFSSEEATKGVKRYDYQKRWLIAEGTLTLTDNLSLRLRLGQEKGGLVCSGGVCRYEPPFFGIKSVLLMRF